MLKEVKLGETLIKIRRIRKRRGIITILIIILRFSVRGRSKVMESKRGTLVVVSRLIYGG